MPSSFFGLHVAYTGLNAAQAAITSTANNISNVNTKGYSRQTVSQVAAAAQRTFTDYGCLGTGVQVEAITQSRDIYYDEKYWTNNSRLGLFEKKAYYMEQIENYYSDNETVAGFSTLYSRMFNALDAVKENSNDASVRNEFISNSQELMSYFNSTAISMQDLQSSINDEIKTTVDTINSISQKVALLNKQINIIELEGGHANELRDQRALLIDELSKIVPIEAKEVEVTNSNFEDQKTGATYFSVKFNGNLLVDNYNYNTLSIVTREKQMNQSDVTGLYDVKWDFSGAIIDFSSASMEGEMKAMFDVRDGNNAENLKGKVVNTGANSITITNATITDIEKMNMPHEGRILVNSTYYNYSDFEVETDANGLIKSYKFILEKPLTSDERSGIIGKNLVVGDTVDYKGIPYYMNQMNEFLRSFSKEFNDIERTGQDSYGNPMRSFFVGYDAFAGRELDATDPVTDTVFSSQSNTYYRMTALNARVNKASQADPKLFATTIDLNKGVDANDLIPKLSALESDVKLFRGGGGNAFLQCIYADITVDTQEAKVFTSSYTGVQNVIEQQRMSVSAVDEDDEALDLVKFKNAYSLASKCISVLTEMYDQLILNTGT